MPLTFGQHKEQWPQTIEEKSDAVPASLLPHGAARAQLLAEARAGGPLIDVYTKGPMSNDYTAGGKLSYVIERPLAGRPDSRWSPVEWSIWVEAGMNTMSHCGLCDHMPVTFAIDKDLTGGQLILICYDCHNAIEGTNGMSKHAVITCPECGQIGLQLVADIPQCLMCFNGKRKH